MTNLVPDTDQANAVIAALQGRDRLITGGPGTGKTTLIKQIAEGLNGKCDILAPTGKAAARLKEVTGFPAYTIHRELQYDGERFLRKSRLGVVIIDEASMIESSLMATVLEYSPTQLILVGDSAQLPPVGRGQPFHDLIRLRPDIVSTLNTCHRASGAVHIAAQEIRKGRNPNPSLNSGGETWTVMQTGEPKRTTSILVEWAKDGRFDPTQDIILAPVYGAIEDDSLFDGGILSINREIKAALNPSDAQFAVGDRVLIVKNYANDDLWNGDIGTISDINTADLPEVRLDRDADNPRQLKKEHMRDLRHAYCLSVHKSQGSQFRRVFFVCFRRNTQMLNRELIYTAITRARVNVVVCGEVDAFARGIKQTMSRKTVMQVLANREDGVL